MRLIWTYKVISYLGTGHCDPVQEARFLEPGRFVHSGDLLGNLPSDYDYHLLLHYAQHNMVRKDLPCTLKPSPPLEMLIVNLALKLMVWQDISLMSRDIGFLDITNNGPQLQQIRGSTSCTKAVNVQFCKNHYLSLSSSFTRSNLYCMHIANNNFEAPYLLGNMITRGVLLISQF